MKCYLELLVLAVAVSSFVDGKKISRRNRRAIEFPNDLNIENELIRTKRKIAAHELLRVKRLRDPEPELLRAKRMKRTTHLKSEAALTREKRDPVEVALHREKRDPTEKILSRVKRLPTDEETLKRMKRVRRNIVKKSGPQMNLSKFHQLQMKRTSRTHDGNRELRKRMKNAIQKHRAKTHRQQQRGHFRMSHRNNMKHAHKRPAKKNLHLSSHSGAKARRNMKPHHVQHHAV